MRASAAAPAAMDRQTSTTRTLVGRVATASTMKFVTVSRDAPLASRVAPFRAAERAQSRAEWMKLEGTIERYERAATSEASASMAVGRTKPQRCLSAALQGGGCCGPGRCLLHQRRGIRLPWGRVVAHKLGHLAGCRLSGGPPAGSLLRGASVLDPRSRAFWGQPVRASPSRWFACAPRAESSWVWPIRTWVCPSAVLCATSWAISARPHAGHRSFRARRPGQPLRNQLTTDDAGRFCTRAGRYRARLPTARDVCRRCNAPRRACGTSSGTGARGRSARAPPAQREYPRSRFTNARHRRDRRIGRGAAMALR